MSRKIKAPETFSEAKTLGDRLRLIISQLGITAKEFAEKCGRKVWNVLQDTE